MMGVGVIKNHFREDIDDATAMANTSSFAMSDMYYLPPGTLPPMVQPYDPTASIPLCLLTVSSDTRSGKELYDIAYFHLRNMLGGVEGIIAPAVYGGKLRRIYIYVEPEKLEARGLSSTEVMKAVQQNTTMIPSGEARIGNLNYGVNARGMIEKVEEFNNIIVKFDHGDPVYIKDIGWVEDAGAIQTNIVRVNGKRQVYLPIFKRPGANTIRAVETIKNSLTLLQERLPNDVVLNVIFDQSDYARKSIRSTIQAGLNGLILVIIVLIFFLGSFRSALIVSLSLPLSIMFAIVGLFFFNESINTITLGGLALVVGLLVDNSIVVLENTDRHLKMGKPPTQAALEAAIEVMMPVLVSTLVIVVVFFPVVFLTGIAKHLFSPLAITVSLAMAGSYFFSLTLIPITAAHFFPERLPGSPTETRKGLFLLFGNFVTNLGSGYQKVLARALRYRFTILVATFLLFGLSIWLGMGLGRDLFPSIDVGQMTIYVRMEPGTPLEIAERKIMKIEKVIQEELDNELNMIVSNIGVFFDLPAAWTPNSGTQDAFIKIQLTDDHKTPTGIFVKNLRTKLQNGFHGVEFSFNTGGMITAALNEGLSSPIDIQIQGNDLFVAQEIARKIRDNIKSIEGARDIRIMQRLNQPFLDIRVDREKAAEMGVNAVEATKNLVSALNSSTSFEKAFWIDERNGNHYFVGVTYPEYQIDQPYSLENIMISSPANKNAIPLKNFASITHTSAPTEINHLNLTRVTNIFVNVENKDINSVATQIENRIKPIKEDLPEGYRIAVRGEFQIMKESFQDLGTGLILAILLVYLIIVPLFRNFRQPLIIIFSIPLGLMGVIWMLWLTNTYLNIQSIMGIIMMAGIAVSYGNILIDRINQKINEGLPFRDAIIEGAGERFRPVLMTTFTTVFGLFPLALEIQLGSEANAPLARAIIGGTLAATALTFFIIPILYSILSKKEIT